MNQQHKRSKQQQNVAMPNQQNCYDPKHMFKQPVGVVSGGWRHMISVGVGLEYSVFASLTRIALQISTVDVRSGLHHHIVV
jgi:hypothetical protein